MLKTQHWFNFFGAAETEVLQGLDEGKDVSGYLEEAVEIDKLPVGDEQRLERLWGLLDKLSAIPADNLLDHKEPSTLEGIQEARPKLGIGLEFSVPLSQEALFVNYSLYIPLIHQFLHKLLPHKYQQHHNK